jgi:anti-sigma regulatory factor (Ser/Thr protein kinase)
MPTAARPTSPHLERQTELPRDDAASAQARAFIDEHFGELLSEGGCENAKIVVSELVTNAVVHGAGRITLKTHWSDERLRVEVVDEGTGNAPAIREQGGDRSGGWGLRLVDALALEWGAYEGTTHVWVDMPAA